MTRRLVGLGLAGLFLLQACSEKETTAPGSPGPVLSVPETYATPQAAAAVAGPGDKIVIRYRQAAYQGDLDLPADVQLLGHFENPLLPRLEGQVRVIGSGSEVAIRGLAISNASGSGVVLIDSDCLLESLLIQDCDGPAIELVGDSHATISDCDLERCLPGVLIRDTTAGGHYNDPDHPSVRISSCNFFENGDPGALSNIVFSNIAALYTVYVKWNYWGEGVTDIEGINATILDNKDDGSLLGLAFTEAEDNNDVFSWWPQAVSHWWQD